MFASNSLKSNLQFFSLVWTSCFFLGTAAQAQSWGLSPIPTQPNMSKVPQVKWDSPPKFEKVKPIEKVKPMEPVKTRLPKEKPIKGVLSGRPAQSKTFQGAQLQDDDHGRALLPPPVQSPGFHMPSPYIGSWDPPSQHDIDTDFGRALLPPPPGGNSNNTPFGPPTQWEYETDYGRILPVPGPGSGNGGGTFGPPTKWEYETDYGRILPVPPIGPSGNTPPPPHPVGTNER